MTILERFRNEHPNLQITDEKLISRLCPSDFGYEQHSYCEDVEGDCQRCWNRECEQK